MTIFRVPVIVTLAPGNLKAEGLHEVGECPGYQDVVVDPNVDRQHHHAIADPSIVIFNNLETVSSATIDIRQNHGTSELHPDTIAIATGKGWTVST